MNDRILLYAVSFLTNAAILIFEIAGGRLLAPYLGTSVEVWAGLISVVLGGMALGYHLGGKIGDTEASKKTIVHFLFGAGLAALFAWSVRDLVPTAFALLPLPLTLNAILVCIVLFMPTVFLLAIVSPLIAKNLLTGLDTSARVVGTLNAVGTVGSIIGAILTGLVLVPLFGVDWIVLSVSILLFVLALAVGGAEFFKRIFLLFLVVGMAVFLNGMPTRSDFALADVSTSYNRILIEEYGTSEQRFQAMSTDPFGTQCSMRILEDGTMDESTLVFRYLRGFESVTEHFFPDAPPERALFLGGCNYSFPRSFLLKYPSTQARVVEIDPGMTKAAQDFFSFNPAHFPTLSITHEDARIYLNKHTGYNDIIFMDAFGSASNIPAHLTTRQMFERLRANLSENGVLTVNAISAVSGERAELTQALLATMRSVFQNVEVYAFPEPADEKQNLIILASNRELPSTIRGDLGETLVRADVVQSTLILSDTYAPVEYLTRLHRSR